MESFILRFFIHVLKLGKCFDCYHFSNISKSKGGLWLEKLES